MSTCDRSISARRTRRTLSLLPSLIALLVASQPAMAASHWTGPALVGPGAECGGIAATVDGSGTFHVAAGCANSIQYSVEGTGTWSATTLSHTPGARESAPELAVDGMTLYAAFGRVVDKTTYLVQASDTFARIADRYGLTVAELLAANPAIKNPNQIAIGDRLLMPAQAPSVYYRTRALPGGAWSSLKLFGRRGDVLQSFRAVNGTLHATVLTARAVIAYQTNASGVLKRYALPGATYLGGPPTSLRVGSDGLARIVYQARAGIRYGIFTGAGFQWSDIPDTNGLIDGSPRLVLDARNRAHVIWARPLDNDATFQPGTFYATNASGTWTAPGARRITTKTGAHALTMDVISGRVHVLLGTQSDVRYYTKAARGSWSLQTLTAASAASVEIRLDQPKGTLLAVYAHPPTSRPLAGVYAMTKP